MDRETIESRDKVLVRKFREKVESKERAVSRNSSGGISYRIWVPVVFVVLFLSGVVAIQDHTPAGKGLTESPEADKERVVINTGEAPAIEKRGERESGEARLSEFEVTDSKVPENKDAHSETVNGIVVAEETVLTENNEKQSAPESSKKTVDISIQKIVTCKNVVSRQYESAEAVFSLQETPKPYVWMTAMADNPPVKLTHVYYLNGRKYCEVPLKISYPRTRTWSNVTLSAPEHLGVWRVDVLSGDGLVIGQVEFEVVL